MKYLTGNQVAVDGRGVSRPGGERREAPFMVSRERGMALIAVITVLVALVLIATTYMMIQQDQDTDSGRSRGRTARSPPC